MSMAYLVGHLAASLIFSRGRFTFFRCDSCFFTMLSLQYKFFLSKCVFNDVFAVEKGEIDHDRAAAASSDTALCGNVRSSFVAAALLNTPTHPTYPSLRERYFI